MHRSYDQNAILYGGASLLRSHNRTIIYFFAPSLVITTAPVNRVVITGTQFRREKMADKQQRTQRHQDDGFWVNTESAYHGAYG